MLYLGHIIGVDGVRVHEEKIRAIRDWLELKNMTELWGFVWICTYYRKFVKGFSHLATPLTDLTKKGAFSWTDTAQRAFDKLKEVMSSCPVLALPDFTQPFVLKCDALGEGIGTVLMQGGHPIAFESRKLLPHDSLYGYIQQGDVGHHACIGQVSIVPGGEQIQGEDGSQQPLILFRA